MLPAKGAASDFSQWVRHDNQELKSKEFGSVSEVGATQPKGPQSADSLRAHRLQNESGFGTSAECPVNMIVPDPVRVVPDVIIPPHTISDSPKCHTQVAPQPNVGVAADQMPGLNQNSMTSNITVSSNLLLILVSVTFCC